MPILPGTALIVVFIVLAAIARHGRWLPGMGFTFMVFAFGTAAFTFPAWFVQWGEFELKTAIAPLVQLILFGMGMTLSFGDFQRILKMPRAIFIGAGCQYLIMPLTALACASLFGLKGEVAAGLILIGSCPGGVSSNVLAFLARANVPLSVSMTIVSTLLSPFLTPLAMKVLAGTYVPIEFLPMMLSILSMVIAPLLVGILIHCYLPKVANLSVKVLPGVAMLSICIIIAITIALSRDDLMKVGIVLLFASAVHNAAGYALGYGAARACRLNRIDSRTVALEVGIQNGGMATGLAINVLHSTQAAMASALFGPWSAITSSALASWWRRTADALPNQPNDHKS
ncbi:MAG: bile acid:sodium symporter family protein [Akkermansiaceae bacterium]